MSKLVEAIRQRVARLDEAEGKQAAVDYLKPFAPNLSRQQLNAWLKNGKFPPEILNGFFDIEFEDGPDPTPAPPQPQPRKRPAPLQEEVIAEVDEPPPTSEFVDERDATLPPNMIDRMRTTAADGKPLPDKAASRLPSYGGPVRRTADIQRLERPARAQDGDEDPYLEKQVIAILHRLGVRMPALEEAPTNGRAEAELIGAQPKFNFRQRAWNAPQTAK